MQSFCLFTWPQVSLRTKNLLRRQWQGEGGHYRLATRLSSTEKETWKSRVGRCLACRVEADRSRAAEGAMGVLMSISGLRRCTWKMVLQVESACPTGLDSSYDPEPRDHSQPKTGLSAHLC